jgi:hypothetical protein
MESDFVRVYQMMQYENLGEELGETIRDNYGVIVCEANCERYKGAEEPFRIFLRMFQRVHKSTSRIVL